MYVFLERVLEIQILILFFRKTLQELTKILDPFDIKVFFIEMPTNC